MFNHLNIDENPNFQVIHTTLRDGIDELVEIYNCNAQHVSVVYNNYATGESKVLLTDYNNIG